MALQATAPAQVTVAVVEDAELLMSNSHVRERLCRSSGSTYQDRISWSVKDHKTSSTRPQTNGWKLRFTLVQFAVAMEINRVKSCCVRR